MIKLSYMWDGHPTTLVVLSRYCLFHSLCTAEAASCSCEVTLTLTPSQNDTSLPTQMSGRQSKSECMSSSGNNVSLSYSKLMSILFAANAW